MMKTQTRRQLRQEEQEVEFQPEIARYDEVTDEDIELFLAEAEDQKREGFWNLPTVAGLSLILFGTGYLLQELGFWTGFNLASLAQMLPWLAGILIILIGFGVLNWKPRSRKREARQEAKRAARQASPATASTETATVKTASGKKKLRKSHNKKLFGVCGGIADYFNLDPTIVRIAFVVGMFFSAPAPVVLYIILAFILPPPEPKMLVPATQEKDETVYIIRDR